MLYEVITINGEDVAVKVGETVNVMLNDDGKYVLDY